MADLEHGRKLEYQMGFPDAPPRFARERAGVRVAWLTPPLAPYSFF